MCPVMVLFRLSPYGKRRSLCRFNGNTTARRTRCGHMMDICAGQWWPVSVLCRSSSPMTLVFAVMRAVVTIGGTNRTMDAHPHG